LNEAQKAEKVAANEANRQRKIWRTADRNSGRARAEAERRSRAGFERLAVEASRKSTRRKTQQLTAEEKAEKARLEARRRSTARAELLAAKAIRKSAHRKTNALTVEQKAEKAVADATRYRKPRLTVEQKAENVILVTERRNAKSSQAAIVRLLDRRHRYAIR